MMKNLNRLLVVFVSLLVVHVASICDVVAQDKLVDASLSTAKSLYANDARSKGFKVSSLKGGSGVFTDLASQYCSNEGDVTISHTNISWHADTENVSWQVRTVIIDGGPVVEYHPSWIDVSGSGNETDVVFHIDNRIDAKYHEIRIYFDLYEYDSDWGPLNTQSDYTTIYLYPNGYDLSVDDAEICENESTNVNLSDSDIGVEYELLDAGNNVIDTKFGTGEAISFSVTPAINTTYHIDAKNDSHNVCSESMNNTVAVSVNPLPIADADNNGPLCEGEVLNLTGEPNGMLSYSWTGPGTFSSGAQNPVINPVAVADAGVYTLVVSDGKNCTNTAQTTVVIRQNPSVIAGSDSPVCQGSDLHLTATPSGGSGTYNTFTWTGPNTFSSGEEDPTIVAATTAATGTYSVTVTDDLGCSTTAAATTDVTVNVRPTVSVGYNDKVCLNSSLILTATPNGGSGNFINYVWRKDGSVISGENGSTLTIASSALSDAGDYSVTVQDDSGCISDAANVGVTIYSLPIASANNDGAVCEGEDLNLLGGPVNMTSYSWSGPNTFSSSSQSPSVSGITLAGDGIYTLTVTDGNGCTDSESTTVVVNENPTINADSDSPVCQGSDLHLTSEPSGGSGTYSTFIWTGPNTFSSGEEGPTIVAATAAASGTYSVTVTDDLGCSTTAAATTDVIVNVRPTVSVGYNDKVCLNSSLILTATPNGGSGNFINYVWRKDGSVISGENGSTLTIASSALSDAGDYSVTVQDDSGCISDAANVGVTIYTLPIASANNDGAVCEGDDLNLLGGPVNMASYSWSGPNTFSSSSQSPSVSGITLAGDGVYTLTVVDGNGCTDSESTTVVVNENPTINAGSDSPVCQRNDLHLTSEPSGGSGTYSTFAWTGPNSFSSNEEDPTIVAATTAASGTYNVIVTDNLGCSNSIAGTTVVSVNERPTVSLGYNNPVCFNTSIILTAVPSGGSGNYVNYIWTKDGNLISGENGSILTIDPAALSDGGTYGVIVEDNSGCSSDEATVLVTVHDLPSPSISSNGPLCEGEDLNLGGLPNGMISYVWSGPNGWTNNADQNPTISNVDINNAGTYALTVEDVNTCTNTATVDVVINQVQADISVSAPQPGSTEACAGIDVTFNAAGSLGSGNYSYVFHRIRGAVDDPVHSGSTTYTTPDLQDGDQIYVVATDNTTLCADASNVITMTINANPIPALNITSAGGNVVCLGSVVDFVASPGFDRYIYYRNGSEVLQDDVNNTFSSSILADGDQISVVAYDGDCFGASPPISMTVHDLPTVTLSGDASTVCENQDVLFTATGAGTGSLTYQFFVDGNPETGIQADNTFTWHSLNDFAVEVRIFDGNNCENISSAVNVTISKPVATLTADQTTICQGEEIVFTAGGGVSYEFFVNTVSVQGPDVSEEFRSTTLANNDNITVTATDTYGCTAAHSGVTVNVNPVPVVSLSSSDADNIICATDEVTYTVAGGDVYEFFIDGTSVQGPGSESQFSSNTLNDGESISAIVSYSTSGCATPTGNITMTVNPLPTATLNAVPGSSIIAGTNIVFTAGGGAEYVFAVNGTVVQPRGPDNTFESATLVNGDVVSVDVYDGNDCMSSESLTINVFDSVILLDVLTTEPAYCEGETGVSVYVGGTPQDGITYELFRTSDNSKVEPSIMYSSATPVDVRWNDIQGTDEYRVEAFYTDVPAERFEMNNRVMVTEYLLPNIYNLTSLSSSPAVGCNGGSGHVISLDNSQTEVEYTLYLNDVIPIEVLTGIGSQLDFSAQLGIGSYTILAESVISGCQRYMSGTFSIEGEDLKTNLLYVVDPANENELTDGRYCENVGGVELALDGSLDNTVTYKLFRDGNDTGVSLLGNNSSLSFGLVSEEGVYTANIETSTGCQLLMDGYANVSIIPTPTAFNLVADNNGHFCEGEAGVTLSVDDQEEGVEYSLYNGATVLETVTGTDAAGSSLLFTGIYNAEGVYSVEAVVPEVGCTNTMNNTIEVVVDALPDIYDLTSDGDYCSGESTTIHLPGSESNVEYRWHNLDDGSYGPAIIGTGGVLEIEISSTGTYEVTARRTDGVTYCESLMNGTFAITEKPLPEDRFISETYVGTGCGDGSIVTVVMSQVGVQYNLVKKVGSEYYDAGLPSIVGDGNDIDFAPIVDKDNAEYTAMATLNGCSIYLSGSVFIDIAGVVTKQVVTGEGEICNGDPGVVFGLNDTEAGVTYELWLSHKYGVAGENAEETITGDGNSMNFPLVNGEGEYLVVGISVSCEMEMTNRVVLNVNPLPEAYKMIGSGEFCDPALGAEISIDNSEEGVSYMLQYFNGSLLDDKLDSPAIGGAETDTITFGRFTDIGTYTVIATTDKGCTSSMNGVVDVHQSVAPVDQTVVYDSNVYCDGEGVEFSLSDHEADVVYQVIDETNVVVAEVTGTDSGILSLGTNFTEGIYTFQATRGGDACIIPINGGVSIALNARSKPEEHQVSIDSENVCGSIGATITLDGFEIDRRYRIEASYGAILDTITGTDRDPVSWVVTEPVSGEETYEIWAMSMVEGDCDSLLLDVIEISYKDTPLAPQYTLVGGDSYCEGDEGIKVQVTNSENGIGYQLKDDDGVTLGFQDGNGDVIEFVNYIPNGEYHVIARNFESGCFVSTVDTFEIIMNPTPNIEIFQIGDLDCSSEVCYGLVDSDELILDNSAPEEDAITYRLLLNGSEIDPAVDSLSTGGSINFGRRSADGIYTVQAVSNMGCSAEMDGIVRLEQYPLNAEDDYLNLAKGDNTGTVIVPGSDEFTNDTWNPAIDVLYDPEVEGDGNLRFWFNPNSAEVIKDIESGSVIIDEKTGVLVYTKIPGFFGRDSVTYYFKNIEYPDTRPRIDSAKVYIFVGNKGIEEGKTFLIPNAFSPNGDDINDYFKISGIEEDGRYSAEKSKLEVFNRWGALVYRSKGDTYGGDGEWWDGTSTTANMVSIGTDLPNGTYFYVYSVEVNVTGEEKTSVKEYSGYIELRR